MWIGNIGDIWGEHIQNEFSVHTDSLLDMVGFECLHNFVKDAEKEEHQTVTVE